MSDYEVSVEVAVAPETAWAGLRDPSAISAWHPAYVRSHPVRDVRVLERAENVFLVTPLHPGCRVTWWTRAEPDESGRDPGEWLPAEHHRALVALRDYLEDQ